MSRRIKFILIGVGIGVVALVFYFLVISPIRGDISNLQSKIDTENDQIRRLTVELKAAERTRGEGRRNQARLLELAKMIPKDAEIPSLIIQIQDLADKAGIKWILISPSEPRLVTGAGFQVVSLSLSFTGSFYDVNDFIYRAEQMVAGPGRLLTVKDLSFAPKGPDSSATSVSTSRSPNLDVRITLDAFMLAPEAAAAAPADTSGGTPTTTQVQ